MASKTVCQHVVIIPQLGEFLKKYYFLIAQLLFEYKSNGHFEDELKIIGFNTAESAVLSKIFSFFEQESDTILRIRNFDIYLLCEMASILTSEQQKLLVDHIVLSSIDKASDFPTLGFYLKTNIAKVGASIPMEYFSGLDFLNFFKGEDSTFMNYYYPSNDSKDKIRKQYKMKS